VTGYNDSGSGLCWADSQYPGPNGPDHCRNISISERIKGLCETIHKAAIAGGGDITLRIGNVNFSTREYETVLATLPPNTFLNKRDSALAITGGTQINRMYPFKGLVDPIEVLEEIDKLNQPQVTTILIRFADQYYGRADDSPEGVAKFMDVFGAGFNSPLGMLNQRLEALNEISAAWGGVHNKDAVFEAFYKMHSGIEKVIAIAPSYYRLPLFLRVSLRYLNRPLLIKPELLTEEEESYFLPYVFNVYHRFSCQIKHLIFFKLILYNYHQNSDLHLQILIFISMYRVVIRCYTYFYLPINAFYWLLNSSIIAFRRLKRIL
jgi:hypothetical protein